MWCQDTPQLARLIEAATSPAEFARGSFKVDVAVTYLNERLRSDGYELVRVEHAYRLTPLAAADIDAPTDDPATILTDSYVREQLAKCDGKLQAGDFDGAITNARTLVESVLFALEKSLKGTRTDTKGDLPRHFKVVAKLLKLDPDEPKLDERFKEVARGLQGIVSGLAPLRNSLSDAHARVRAPAPHHATLVVNAAKTLVVFLVASHNFQRARSEPAPAPLTPTRASFVPRRPRWSWFQDHRSGAATASRPRAW